MSETKNSTKKIGIVTMHCVPNYGAVLQAYATVEFFRRISKYNHKNELKIEIVDYQPLEKKRRYSIMALLSDSVKSPRSLFRNVRNYSLKSMILSKNLHFNAYDFLFSMQCLSEEVKKKDLIGESKKYDALVTGSDQVWNPYGLKEDYSYLLDFYDNDNKYSFSSSFGITEFPIDREDVYRSLLSKFRHVTVRETAGLKIYEKLTGKNDGMVLLDPTLMLSVEDYERVEDLNFFESLPCGYTLVYLAMHSENLVKYAMQHTDKGKEVIIFGMPDMVCRLNVQGCKVIKVSTIGGFLSLFHKAGKIYTNSFHGIAFSIIYSKDVWIEWNDVHSKSNSRLENIVNRFGLENRIINAQIDSTPIDYGYIRKTIDNERDKAMNYVNQLMSEIGGGVLGDSIFHLHLSATAYNHEEAA